MPQVKSVIEHFLGSVSYETPSAKFDKDLLYSAILHEIQTWDGVDARGDNVYGRIAEQAAALVEVRDH